MADIRKRSKPLAVNPLKASPALGASLAFLGLRNCLPMLHGSQGCTAFGKVFFVRHFREPIPLQTTAMDHVSTIMNADENVIEGLKVICEKNAPDIIGLPTTGVSETQGTDIRRVVQAFRTRHPQFDKVAVVPVNTPDYCGGLESGYALALEAIIDTLVPESAVAGRRRKQVNVLASSMLNPGDIEAIKEWIEAFGLRPVLLPDIGDSLDGHLIPQESSALTLGGTPLGEIACLGEAAATLVIGRSLNRAADLLKARTGVPDFRFNHLLGMDACDAFTSVLAELSGVAVPARIERQRAQLQDAMVDTHFMTGFLRVGIAADPDLLVALGQFLTGVGAEIAVAVAPERADVLADMPCDSVQIGDLEDLERAATADSTAPLQLVISNSHAVATAERLGVPLLRAGYPQYDRVGGHTTAWAGYRGSRQTLFNIANLYLGSHHDIPVHRSLFWAGTPRQFESRPERPATAGAGLVGH
ncbi:MAG: nitrogenase iron-molybdenum cofactor biosynthesis protein NifN [Georgfuchsia sp.]